MTTTPMDEMIRIGEMIGRIDAISINAGYDMSIDTTSKDGETPSASLTVYRGRYKFRAIIFGSYLCLFADAPNKPFDALNHLDSDFSETVVYSDHPGDSLHGVIVRAIYTAIGTAEG